MPILTSILRRLFGKQSDARSASKGHDLEFFNSLCGTLEIELDQPAEPVANLLNLAAKPEAEVVALRLSAEVFLNEQQGFRDLTEEELDRVVFRAPKISLRGESGAVVEHSAPNGEHFNIQELLLAVEETERRTRGQGEWLGGVDVHHIFFEGIEPDEEGIWEIRWGS